MKKWLIILMTTFFLSGCTNNIKDTTSYSEKNDTQNEISKIVNTSENETSKASQSNLTNDVMNPEMIHEYFCDKFILTVDDNQIDLTNIDPELSSVSELYPIANEQLYILGRIDENYNSLMIYDFTKKEIIFSEHGTTMCWVQGKFETARYLKDNVVYDLNGNVIYQPEDGKLIDMIEYVVEDFMVTVTDSNYENPEEIWIE